MTTVITATMATATTATETSTETTAAATTTAPVACVSSNLTNSICHTPVRNRRVEFNVLNVVLGTFTISIIIIRLGFKRFYSARRKLSADDWTIAMVIPFGLATIGVLIFGLTWYGMGEDVWGLQPDDLPKFGLHFWIAELGYTILMTLIKTALCLFYLGIFISTIVRRILWVTVVIQVLWGITIAAVIVFQCTPISFYWEKFDLINRASGGCMSSANQLAWAFAGFSVAIDLWLLAIPLSQLGKMNLHWKKKIGAALMFLTGAIVTIISVLRLRSLVHFNDAVNPTWNEWDVVWWSTIELNVGAICVCLPAIRLVLLRMWPRVFSTDTQRRNYYYAKRPGTFGSANSTNPGSKPVVDAATGLGTTFESPSSVRIQVHHDEELEDCELGSSPASFTLNDALVPERP
ncbi:hypothetical protein DCS_02434 [Drechmeria coniospora]|uniref:Rhodopsin domain-containing protein n=1 Tax=Drechmeria coniospora TaxID=98403 RepID=A0A151GW85_DRECN|nr:hypothetical protein DCS_02434 [Drechmeria coniospora]KYK61292.1 hypothetical protein DCS_02434 [Drechmeria coniospora]